MGDRGQKPLVALQARRPAGSNSLTFCVRRTTLSANELRHRLGREEFDLSGYSQPLATVSVTLRHQVDSGRAKAIRENRKVTYQWIGD